MIAARGLTKRYGAVPAVDGLSFDVLPGRVTGFLGPNGAGKSTTMRLILGLDRPTAGTVTVNGCPYRGLRRPLHLVGAMLESRALHPGRSAAGHLLALAHASGLPRRRVGEVLALAGLEAVAGKRAGGFSLGMTQRLGIAAALLGDPPVLLLDEPVNGLDPDGVAWIRALLRSLAAEGRTVLVSSHLMSEMESTADHLIVIGRGRLIADTSLGEFTRRASGGWVEVSSPDAGRLARLLGEQGAAVGAGPDGESLAVRGLGAAAVGDLAARHLTPASRAALDPAAYSQSGFFLAQLAIGALGVLTVTGEYATGSIRSTLAAAPQRVTVLAAKAAVFTAVAFLTGLAGSLAAFFLGQAIFAPKGIHEHLGGPGTLRAVLGAALYLAVLGLLALGLGALTRRTAGALAILIAVLIFLPVSAGALPAAWQDHINPYLPSAAGQAIIGATKFAPAGHLLSPWTGLTVLCGYTAAVLTAAAITISRRDA